MEDAGEPRSLLWERGILSYSPGQEASQEAGWPFFVIELRLFPELQAVWSQWNLHINRGTWPLKEGRRGLKRSLVYRLQGYSEHNKKLQISFPTSQGSAWVAQDFYCSLLKYYPGSELQSRRSSPICLARALPQTSAPCSQLQWREPWGLTLPVSRTAEPEHLPVKAE